jgi:hypothetical protein
MSYLEHVHPDSGSELAERVRQVARRRGLPRHSEAAIQAEIRKLARTCSSPNQATRSSVRRADRGVPAS